MKPVIPNYHSIQPRLCCYDTSYQPMYQPSYDTGFVFYDEDELNDCDDVEVTEINDLGQLPGNMH